jgi:uncharacterized protein YlxW (UPF0749 family)
MSLITSLMTDTLDPGYAEAAARRRESGEGPPSGRGRLALVAGVVVVGMLLATAVVETRGRSNAAGAVRTELAEEVERRTATVDRLQAQVEALQADISVARQEALSLGADSFFVQRLTALEVDSGAAAVQGPGLVVTVDDSAEVTEGGDDPRDAEPGAEDSGGRVLDYDLQRVVNGLWAAGAEAVAINDRRLTSLAAIRSAGRAILVDYRPLSPPYVVEALGDPDTIEARFADSAGGRYLQALKENHDIEFDVEVRDSLRLPAASGATLRYAKAVAPPATPTGAPEKEESR